MNQPNAGSGAGVGGHACFILMMAAAGGTAFMGYSGDFVAAAVVVIAGMGALFGYWRGAFGFLALVAAGVAGYTFGGTVDQYIGPYLSSVLSDPGPTIPSWRLALSGLLTAGAVQLVLVLIGRTLMDRSATLRDLNHTAGLFLGGAQATAGVALFLCGLLTIEPLLAPSAVPAAGAQVSTIGSVTGSLTKVAQQTRTSAIYPYLVQYDPFQRFPQLRETLLKWSPSGAGSGAPSPSNGAGLSGPLIAQTGTPPSFSPQSIAGIWQGNAGNFPGVMTGGQTTPPIGSAPGGGPAPKTLVELLNQMRASQTQR